MSNKMPSVAQYRGNVSRIEFKFEMNLREDKKPRLLTFSNASQKDLRFQDELYPTDTREHALYRDIQYEESSVACNKQKLTRNPPKPSLPPYRRWSICPTLQHVMDSLLDYSNSFH
jgi:hypothetical protein